MSFSFSTIFSRLARSFGFVAIFSGILVCSEAIAAASQSDFVGDGLVVQVTGQRIQGAGISLILPVNFHGGNPQTELATIETRLSRVVSDSSDRLAFVRNSPIPVIFLAFDSALDSAGFLTNVNAVVESISAEIGLEDYLTATTRALSATYNIVEEEVVTVNQMSMGRVIAEQTQLKQLFYLIPRGDRFYVIVYSASATEFPKRLSMFERSIQTVQFQR
ncbi:MAG: hypothetical protein AB4290_16975 [Spirulina sp.]